MKKYIQIFIIFLKLTACGQNATKMKTPEHTNEKFVQFIAEKKFIETPHPNFYPGIAYEKIRPVLSEKINQTAIDFKTVAQSEKTTDKVYQEKIKIGLSRFAFVYMELDTEDRERICSYFEELMDIVGLDSSEGQLNDFMYGFDPNELNKNNKSK